MMPPKMRLILSSWLHALGQLTGIPAMWIYIVPFIIVFLGIALELKFSTIIAGLLGFECLAGLAAVFAA